MNRTEFMRQLQSLLNDISESEREEALAYYNSYFDDAGEENESKVIQELGSPGKLAAIIKSDLEGGAEDYAEYTERGYQDCRTEESNSPQVYGSESQTQGNRQSRAERGYRPRPKYNSKGNIILLVIILVFASPLIIGIGGTLIGAAASIILGIISIVATLAIGAFAALLAGVVLVGVGIYQCFANPALGLLSIAIGLFSVTAGLILAAMFALLIMKFLPWLIKKVVGFCQKLLQKGRRKGGASV